MWVLCQELHISIYDGQIFAGERPLRRPTVPTAPYVHAYVRVVHGSIFLDPTHKISDPT